MADQKPPLIVEFDGQEYEFPAEATDAQISRFLKAIPAANAKEVPAAKTWTAKFPNVAAAARGVVNTLPAVGAMVGGVVATPESFGLATVPGAALGAGAGRGLRDLIAEATGLDEPTSALSKAGRIGLDTVETGALQAVLPGAVEAVKTPIKTIDELLKVMPASRKIARFLELGKTAKALRPVKAPTPLLERPVWQSASAVENVAPEAVEPEMKAVLKPAAKAAKAVETAAGKTKAGGSAEQLLEMALRKAGLGDDAITPALERFRGMSFSEQLRTLQEVSAELSKRRIKL